MNGAITKGYKKKMEQILERELGVLSVDYLERTT
jgi:hypothetical protein